VKVATLAAATGLAAAAIAVAVFPAAASATTINVVTTDTADSYIAPYDFGGSLLSVDFTFDLASGKPSLYPALSNVSGTATWTDGTAMSFSPTSGDVYSLSVDYINGSYFADLEFNGPGVALPGGTH